MRNQSTDSRAVSLVDHAHPRSSLSASSIDTSMDNVGALQRASRGRVPPGPVLRSPAAPV